MKKMGYFLRIALLIIISSVLMVYSPVPKTLAQTSSCTFSSEAGIKLFSGGFLGVTSQDDANNFSPADKYICGSKASIPQFSLPSYAEIKSLYFDQSKLEQKFTVSEDSENQINLSAHNQDKLYHFTSSLTVSTNINAQNSSGIIFVDGNLLIKTSKLDKDSSSTGLVFIVGGNVYIDKNTGGSSKPLNAFFVTFGTFCSASTGDNATTATCQPAGTTASQLTINGSVISLGTSSPQFVRSLTDNTDPAEIINYQPKYLVILKDLFARDLKIWQEIQ